ncbi:MAG: phenylacetate--CoA ligase family protein [Promethearchaeota archaeon]
MKNNPAKVIYHLVTSIKRLSWPKKKIYKYGTRKLREIIHYAYNWSPYYRKLFKQNSIIPEKIKNFEDLSKIPVTTKEDLKNNIEKIYSKEFSINQCQKSLTAGSTGIPMEIRYDWNSSNYSRAINLRSHMIWGLKPFTRFCFTAPDYAIPKENKFSPYYPIFNPYYLNIYRPIKEGIKFLINYKIKFLSGYTSYIGLIAREVLDHGISEIKLIGGCGTSDQMTPKIKLDFEKAFGSKIGDLIGAVEVNRTAWECPYCGEYHLDIDSVFTEFLDENFEECDANEQGQIVYTTLFNKGTPIIRYAIEDVGIKGENDLYCPKYKFPTMKKFMGRMDDFFESPEGIKVSPIIWNVIGKRYQKLKQFQFIQTNHNTIVVKVVYNGPDDLELENKILKDVIRIAWKGVNVYCERVDEIEKNKGGKLRCAIKKKKEDFYCHK